MDVDILYLALRPSGALFPSSVQPPVLGYLIKYGRNRQHGHLTFDAERNWTFLLALRRQTHVRVAKVFVEPFIEEWLLEEGRRSGASAEELRWARDVLRYAGANALDHKDHMHIRFVE